MEVNIYIGFWTLKAKCTQYGICSQVAFKNARAMFCFQSWAGRTIIFSWVQKIPGRATPARIRHPPKFVGGCLMYAVDLGIHFNDYSWSPFLRHRVVFHASFLSLIFS